MTIYEKIKCLRQKQGLSQQELAEKVGFKTASAVNKIELGLRDISQKKVIAFANALTVTPAYLSDWESDELDITEGGEDMTQDEKKKLLNALKIIREECSKHKGKSCEECSLCTDEGCKLKIDAPRDWLLSNEKKDIWRAFS